MSKSAPATLASIGEKGLLHALTSHWKCDSEQVLTGVGDDCAVLRGQGRNHYLIFKTDAVVENVHFRPDEKPEWIGRKALARALSDLAAMGASPTAAVVTLGLPAKESVARLKGVYRGLEKMAKQYRVNLVGGETTRAAQLFLNIALMGECRGYLPVLRSGAKAGDLIYVTGRLGGTQARHHLLFEPRLEEGQWLARNRLASALMDLSDGLGADLPRLAEASRLDYHLDAEQVPRSRGATLQQALNDGEDYELLFTASPSHAKSLKKKWPFETALHCIGVMQGVGTEATEPKLSHGFDHFKER